MYDHLTPYYLFSTMRYFFVHFHLAKQTHLARLRAIDSRVCTANKRTT